MESSTRYSALVDAKLRHSLVLKDGVIFNNRYEGSVKDGAVKIRKTGTSIVQDYDRANGVDLTSDVSEWITIATDKEKSINDIIDMYNADDVPDSIITGRLDDVSRALAETLDRDGVIELVSNGTVMSDTTALNKDTIYDVIVDVRTSMSKIGVPVNQRYLIVSPETCALLLKSDKFIEEYTLGDAVVQTGAVGQIAGFNVYESADLGDGVDFVAGHPLYATRVNEWRVDVHVQDLSGSGRYVGASEVQGRMVYVHKVTEPKAIIVKKTTA